MNKRLHKQQLKRHVKKTCRGKVHKGGRDSGRVITKMEGVNFTPAGQETLMYKPGKVDPEGLDFPDSFMAVIGFKRV